MSAILLISSGDDSWRKDEPPSTDRAAPRGYRDAKVLIVEDEWFISMEIGTALEEAGYEVVGTAITADEAVRMTEMYRPDLVLMDIRLRGERDGIDAAIEISRRFGPCCLFISAHTDPDTRERGQMADPLNWLTKPFSNQKLILAVQASLDRRR